MNSTTRWLASNTTTTASGLEPSFKAGVEETSDTSSDHNTLLLSLPFILIVAGALIAGAVLGATQLRKARKVCPERKPLVWLRQDPEEEEVPPDFDKTQRSATCNLDSTQEGSDKTQEVSCGTDDDICSLPNEDPIQVRPQEEWVPILMPRLDESDSTDTGTSLTALMNNSSSFEPTDTGTSLSDLMTPSLSTFSYRPGESRPGIAPTPRNSEESGSGVSRALIPPLIKE